MAWRYIALGFRTDCFKLLSVFQASNCHTYKSFTEIWREMKFSYIYYERKSFCELLEFTEEVFLVCKEFLHPSNSLPFQIGSIYLMYGLYLKQPTRNHVKIRFTLSEWNLLKNAWNMTLSTNLLDVPLIISRLYLMNAFQFCFTERQMGLEKKFRKYYEGGEKSTGEMLPMTVTPVMEQLDIQALENVCEIFYQYEAARNNLNRLLSSYADVKFKDHFSTEIISNLKGSALETIQKESREINRYCELNGPTDSEDSNDDLNKDAETGIPWWQCKKKMPWWKRCLPFGRKQTEKIKKHEKGNNAEDSSEMSLEEDVDDPDVVEFSEKSRKKSKAKRQTMATNIISDRSSLPSEGNINFDIPSWSSCPVNRRKKSRGKQHTIKMNITSDESSVASEANISFGIPSCSSHPVKRRKKSKGKQDTITMNDISDKSSLSSEGNISFGIPSCTSGPINRRKKSKGKQDTITMNDISDKSSPPSEGNISFGIPSCTSGPVNRRRKSRGKRQAITTNNTSYTSSLLSEDNTVFDIPNYSSCPVNRRMKSKAKQKTVTTNILSDKSLLPPGENISDSSYPVYSREISKEKEAINTMNIVTHAPSVSLEGEMNVVVPNDTLSARTRRKKIKGNSSAETIIVLTNDSSVMEDNLNILHSDLSPSHSEAKKLTKGKKSAKTMKIMADGMAYTSSEGKENVSVPNHPLSPENKRKTNKRKKSASASSAESSDIAISIPVSCLPSLPGKLSKRSQQNTKSAKMGIDNANSFSLCSEGDKYIAASAHQSPPLHKRRYRARKTMRQE